MSNQGILTAGRYGIILMAVVAFIAMGQTPGHGDVPDLMNYQGVLTDANGDPLEATQATLTFNIYGSATGGAPVWGPMIFDNGTGDGHGMRVRLVDGRFNVVLGPRDTASRLLSRAFTGGANRFLEIQVDDNPPIEPRLALLSAPYAIQAKEANRAGAMHGQSLFFWIENNLLPAMFIANDLNVGIGTGNPTHKLHVAGSALITGPANINGFQPLYAFSGGSTNTSFQYVHIRTPDRMRPLIIITEDGEEIDASVEGAIDSEDLEAAVSDAVSVDGDLAAPDDIIIWPTGRTYRHFMIEGIAPNSWWGSTRIISKRVTYTFSTTVLATGLADYASVDMAGLASTYNPVVYTGSDNYLYIRFRVPTGVFEELTATTQDMSFVLFGMRTHSGPAPMTGYSVVISSQLNL